jgi:hypothetical protein
VCVCVCVVGWWGVVAPFIHLNGTHSRLQASLLCQAISNQHRYPAQYVEQTQRAVTPLRLGPWPWPHPGHLTVRVGWFGSLTRVNPTHRTTHPHSHTHSHPLVYRERKEVVGHAILRTPRMRLVARLIRDGMWRQSLQLICTCVGGWVVFFLLSSRLLCARMHTHSPLGSNSQMPCNPVSLLLDGQPHPCPHPPTHPHVYIRTCAHALSHLCAQLSSTWCVTACSIIIIS